MEERAVGSIAPIPPNENPSKVCPAAGVAVSVTEVRTPKFFNGDLRK